MPGAEVAKLLLMASCNPQLLFGLYDFSQLKYADRQVARPAAAAALVPASNPPRPLQGPAG